MKTLNALVNVVNALIKPVIVVVAIATIALTAPPPVHAQQVGTRLASLEEIASTYGGIYENSANGNNISMTSSGVFYPWVGSTTAYTNGVLSRATNLVTTVAGYYKIDAALRGLSGVASTNCIMGAIFTNDVRCVVFGGIGQAAVSPSLQLGVTISGPPVYLPASTRIDVRVANTNANVTTLNFTNQQSYLSAVLVSK